MAAYQTNAGLHAMVTGEGTGVMGMGGLLYFFGRGTSGATTVLQVANAAKEDCFAKGHDDQNAWVVASTRPA
jgi:hypothetical protein